MTAACAVLAAGLLAACGTSGGTGEGTSEGTGKGTADGPPPAERVPKVTSSADVPGLPLDAHALTREQYLTYMKGQRVAARRCMARFGFPDFRGLDSSVDASYRGDRADPSRYFYAIDATGAARYGYHSPPEGPRSTPPPGGGTTAAENAVYQGANAGRRVAGRTVPEGGCSAEAYRVTHEGAQAGVDILSGVSRPRYDLYRQAQRDDRVRAAFAGWSACMRRSGLAYADPMAAQNDVRWRKAAAATREETAVAVADVACKQRTNTVGVWWSVLAAYEKRYATRHRDELADLRRAREAVVRTCARLVAEGER
ncbi:hypothetical protein RKE29_15805 [Streptomyces sp. B1866]|uniref:hypothetical protein n=1 Tax=Streptomyces sp. B1866 TaxID=3075431 RepID=UPI002890746B|nr:hypothetical protein [Streptomyces sp. B1866]MDT3398089.1 hypothetical protein [Streptomyces sp. B1866]